MKTEEQIKRELERLNEIMSHSMNSTTRIQIEVLNWVLSHCETIEDYHEEEFFYRHTVKETR